MFQQLHYFASNAKSPNNAFIASQSSMPFHWCFISWPLLYSIMGLRHYFVLH